MSRGHRNSIFMIHFHTQGEVQYVKPTRQQNRYTERKHNKKASPYFLLKVEAGKPRKVYPPTGRGKGQKKAKHLRRGYFFRQPDSHPFPHLAGKTFYSKPTEVGSGHKNNRQGYYIALSEESQQS